MCFYRILKPKVDVTFTMVVQQSGMAWSRESSFGASLQKFWMQYFFGPEVEIHIIYEIYLLNL